MNLSRTVAAAFAACVVTVVAFAAEASPTGTWKWAAGRAGQTSEQTLKLSYADGKLTGTLVGATTGSATLPDTPIANGSFKDGVVTFSVTREAAGRSATTKYSGKLEGDTIRGTREFPDLQGGGAPIQREWVAQRAK